MSIGVQRRGRMEHGVVYDPMRQELFTASRGEGAQLDGKRIRVSPHIGLERALIGTGFPYRSNLQWLDTYMAMLKAVMQATAGHPPPGRGGARSGLCRGRPAGRILGTRPVALGHGSRNAADHRSRRHGRHA